MAVVTLTRSVGMLLLAIWLIIAGLGTLAPLPIPGVVSGVIALLAGILILIGRILRECGRSEHQQEAGCG